MAEGVAENMEMTEQVAKAKPKKKKLPVVLVFLVLISAFGSSFQYGYNLWEVNHPSADLWNISAVSRQAKTSRSKGFIKFLDALQYSFFSFGGLVGSLFAGPLMDKCGRKGSLVSNSLFSLIAAALMGWSKVRRAYEFTILARFVTGICAGIFASVVPIYLGEIAPQNMRGVIIMVAQLFVAVGVVMAQLFGHPTILGNYRDWTMYMSIIGTSALFQLFLLPSFPESPRYLLIQKRNEKKAREALKVLRGRDDVEDELEELREEDLAEGAEKKMSVLRLIGFEQLRWQLLSVIILMCGRQLSGIYAAYYYAEKIFANMTGVTGQSARFVSVGSTITAIVMLLHMAPWMSYISAALVFIFLVGQAMGPSPLPDMIILEMFLQSSRSSAFVVGGIVHWLCSFITGFAFVYIQDRIGPYSFLVYWPTCIVNFIYIFKIVPETKNKTFLEIRRIMANHVAKIILRKKKSGTRKLSRRSTQFAVKTNKERFFMHR
ncbi:solute carrier family 2, facilitated glucose transporter member 5-like isoform X2 [Hemicordylus capensis]|uniref:solute carrier family 2, facilitated glucose transporter member 5-like isoform X2 n=1 Tax=Hemicordylus capensis TaxID=884348 RepID=UPI002302216B|nr:solute carrier family 2, facilitated glucose transporter member 5-like isoform X2 [Hemicordylus capensis]